MTLFIFKARKRKIIELIKVTTQASKTGGFFRQNKTVLQLFHLSRNSVGFFFQHVHLVELKDKLTES